MPREVDAIRGHFDCESNYYKLFLVYRSVSNSIYRVIRPVELHVAAVQGSKQSIKVLMEPVVKRCIVI